MANYCCRLHKCITWHEQEPVGERPSGAVSDKPFVYLDPMFEDCQRATYRTVASGDIRKSDHDRAAKLVLCKEFGLLVKESGGDGRTMEPTFNSDSRAVPRKKFVRCEIALR